MPLTTLAELKVAKDYKADLKTSIVKAKASALPFRYLPAFPLDTGPDPALLIGKLAAPVVKSITGEGLKVKAQGLCRLVGDVLEFEVERGALNDKELTAALKAAGLAARTASVVAKLSDGSSDRERALDLADLGRRLDGLNARLKKLPAGTPELKTLAGIAARLKRHKEHPDEVDTETPQELLNTYEQGLVAVEMRASKAASAARAKDESEVDSGVGTDEDNDARKQRLSAHAKAIDDKLKAPEAAEPQPLADNPAFAQALQAMQAMVKARAEATRWHEAEIKTQQDAEKLLPQAQASVNLLTARADAVQQRIAQCEQAIAQLETDIANASKYTPGVRKKAQADILKHRGDIKKMQGAVATIRADPSFAKLQELETLAHKHGSSRHGAQTGMEMQARRAATGGISPDQADNPHGVSMSRKDEHDADRLSISWGAVKLTWEELPDGKRKVIDRDKVLKSAVLQAETRLAKTRQSSLFHSPELEKQAVDRAMAIVKGQCPWTEIQTAPGVWGPLDTVTVVLGPPKGAVGWGWAVERKVDAKKVLTSANSSLEKFRDGRIDQDALLAELDVVLSTADDGSVPMVKQARVTLKRAGTAWTSLTHFPSAGDAPGWSLEGKTVRATPTGAGVVAPAARLG